MTIDDHGRAHKPAGSPASTGGQFAAQPAPAPAADLPAADRGQQLFDAWDRDHRILQLRSAAAISSAILDAHPGAAAIRLEVNEEPDPDEAFFGQIELLDRDGRGIEIGATETERLRLLLEASALPRISRADHFSAYEDGGDMGGRPVVQLPLKPDQHDDIADELQAFDTAGRRSHEERVARARRHEELDRLRRLAVRHEDAATAVDAVLALHPDATELRVELGYDYKEGGFVDGWSVIAGGTQHFHDNWPESGTPEDAAVDALRNIGTRRQQLIGDGIVTDVEDGAADEEWALQVSADAAERHRIQAWESEVLADEAARAART